MMRRALVAGLIITGLSGCGGDAGKPPVPAAMPPMKVDVIRVERSRQARVAQLPGRVQAVRTAQVRARVEGIVEKQVCVEGSLVKAGDLLFRIDPTRLRADVDVARAQLAEREADAGVARQTLERVRSLRDNKAVSAQQFDEALARLRQAEAAVKAAEAAVRRAEIDLAFAEVRAPIAGRLGRAQVTEGALVGKDEATLLITIEQTDDVWVNFAQSSGDYLKFRDRMLGDFASGAPDKAWPVELILEDGSRYAHTGALTFADRVVDTRIGSVAMRARFANPEGRLLPGQFVGVRVPFRSTEQVIVVPQRAVQASPQGQFVYRVVEGNIVESVPIKPGGLSGSGWIIEQGLSEGDRIIVEGVQKVRPGAVVDPAES